MLSGDEAIVHGSAVAVAGRGLLLLGPSGSGKSALALALIARGGALVADDRVVVRRHGAALVASAPAPIEGMIEARGFGILRLPTAGPVRLLCAVDLAQTAAARLPQWRKFALLGAEIMLIPGRGTPNLADVLTVFAHGGESAV